MSIRVPRVGDWPFPETPLVSLIQPTTMARRAFHAASLACYQAQTWPAREFVQIWHLGRVGRKRNEACQMAVGEFVAHFDDDDWYAPDHVERLVRLLMANPAMQVAGYSDALFHDAARSQLWRYSNGSMAVGATLLYRRAWWRAHPFPAEKSVGEDNDFVMEARHDKVLITVPSEGRFVARIHPRNTSPKNPGSGNDQYRPAPLGDLPAGFPHEPRP